jgi:small subunit ribosomal protein S7
VAKFVNSVMRDGKKSVAERVVYDMLSRVEKKGKKPGLELFEQAIKNISPSLEIKSRRIGGASYQVPREVRGDRKTTLAFRWLLTASRAAKGAPLAERLTNEVLAAVKNEGAAIKKKEDTHRMAEANRAFAHFSW